jgi:hypothetical protein
MTSLLCCSILSACATQEGRRTVDMTHVNAINQQAEFRNTDIIWVNPPTKIESGSKTTIKISIPMQGADIDSATDAEKEKNPQ